jgi:outer membrane lipoprotein-sorting protein
LSFCSAYSAAEPVVVVEEDRIEAYLLQLEGYFNTLKTFSADFTQIDRKGEESKGYFLVKRPNRVKLYYQPPAENVFVIKDSKITQYNRELKEKNVIPAHSSPLSFLLDPKISLKTNVEVKFIFEDGDVISALVSPRNKNTETDGMVFFTFKKSPLTLLGWEIIDGRNNSSVKIVFSNIRTNVRISDDEFEKLSS